MSTEANDEQTTRYDYAESYFFGFLATTDLFLLEKRSGVMFVGLPRVGKSSAIAVQLGRTLIKRNNEDGSVIYTPKYRKGDPKVSHSTVAKTVNVNFFRNWNDSRNIIDTPGLNDNRSDAFKIWSNFSLDAAFVLTEAIDSTCVVIHYTTSFACGANADSFRDLAVALLANSGTGHLQQCFLDNLCFLLTHAGTTATIPGVVQRLKEVHLEHLNEQANILSNLAYRFPRKSSSVQSAVSSGMNQISKYHGMVSSKEDQKVMSVRAKVARLRGRINFESEGLQEDSLMTTLERVDAAIQLLETMLGCTDRIILSHPDGSRNCEDQRKKLDRAFLACRTLHREDLGKLSSFRRIPSYEVYGVLGHIAGKMIRKLDDFNSSMSTFLKSVEQHDSVIDAIDRDWRQYRDKYKDTLATEKLSKKEQIVSLQKDIDALEGSQTLKAPPENIYNATKCKSGFLQWIGYDRLITTIKHEGPFQEVEVTGNFALYEITKDDEPERVTVTVRSWPCHNIEAQVRFLRFQCDLEETRATIRTKRELIEKLQLEIHRIDDFIKNLGFVSSDEQLMKMVVTDKIGTEFSAIRKASDSLMTEIRTNIVDDDLQVEERKNAELKVPYRLACKGLYRLLIALNVAGGIPDAIRDTGTMGNFKEFLIMYERYDDLSSKFEKKKNAVKLVDASNFRELRAATEDCIETPKLDVVDRVDDPVAKKTFAAVQNFASRAKPIAVCLFRRHPLSTLSSLGLAIATYGLNARPCFAVSAFLVGLAALIGTSHLMHKIKWYPPTTFSSLGFALLSVGIKARPCMLGAAFLLVLTVLVCASRLLYKIRREVKKEIECIRMEVESRLKDLTLLVNEGGSEAVRQVGEARGGLSDFINERGRSADQRFNVWEIAFEGTKAAFS